MMDTSLFLLALEKKGGLFDFDATLPLVAFQFLGLMLVLNLLLYTPLLTAIHERNQYINKNLAKAANLVFQSKQLIDAYEKELINARKETQVELATAQKFHKEAFETEAKVFQTKLERLLRAINRQQIKEKTKLFSSLQRQIQVLSTDLLLKVLA